MFISPYNALWGVVGTGDLLRLSESDLQKQSIRCEQQHTKVCWTASKLDCYRHPLYICTDIQDETFRAMRFIFSLVTNTTYTLFCASIQYVILYFYRVLFFQSLYLLSLSLVVFMLYATVYLYALCIILLIVYDADTFRSQKDIITESNTAIGDNTLFASSSELPDTDVTTAQGTGGGDDDGVDAGSSVYKEYHVDAVITALLCHMTVFCSTFAVFAICLYECIHVPRSVLCRMAYGDHAANNAIGIAMLVLTFSVILPLLNLYKLNVGTSRVLHKHMPSFVIMFTCILHVAIVSKVHFYSVTCPLLVSFSGSLYVVYGTIALHFVFRFAELVFAYFIRHSHHHHHHHHHHHTSPSHIIPTTDNLYSTVFVLISNTVLLLANLAYAWSISTAFNTLQTIVIVIFIISMSHRVIKLPTIRYSKKQQ